MITVRQGLFKPDVYYVFAGGGGNLRYVKTDGIMIDIRIQNPNGTGQGMELSLSLKKIDLPYGITDTTGPWHYVGDTITSLFTIDMPILIALNFQKGIHPIPTLADGLGFSVDNRTFGV